MYDINIASSTHLSQHTLLVFKAVCFTSY